MRRIAFALIFGGAMVMFQGPAGAVLFHCTTYCNDGSSLNSGPSPSTPPVANIGSETLGDDTSPAGSIVTFKTGDTFEDIFDATTVTWVLNFGVQNPDIFDVQIYNTNFTTGYEAGFISPPGGYLEFAPNGTYDVYVTLENNDPPGFLEVTNGVPLSDPPSPTPLPAALPLLAAGLGALGLIARRRKKKCDAALVAA